MFNPSAVGRGIFFCSNRYNLLHNVYICDSTNANKMSKTKRLSITVPIEIYAECVGMIKSRVTSHQLEQAAKQRMEHNLLNVAKNA